MRAVQVLGCAAEGATGAGDSKKGKANAAKDKEWGLELECLTSSIGTYTPAWLAAFRLCAAGRAQSLEKWLDRSKGRGKASTPALSPTTRILFPTLATVRATVLGEAGTVFCRRGQWTGFSKGGVQGLFSDAKSRSGGVGMHTKGRWVAFYCSCLPFAQCLDRFILALCSVSLPIVFAGVWTLEGVTLSLSSASCSFPFTPWNHPRLQYHCPSPALQFLSTGMILGTLVPPAPPPVSSDISDTESESDSDVESIEVKPAKGKGKAREPELEPEPKPHGWVYVGSHNFMPSAWGTLSGRGFNPVINVTNYELGIVIPLATRAEADAAVAWERPARKYGPKDVPFRKRARFSRRRCKEWEGGQVEESFAGLRESSQLGKYLSSCFLTREAVLELVFANEIFIAAADAPAPDITDFWLAEIFVSFSSCKIYGLSDWRGIFGFVALWSSALRNWRSEIGKRMFRTVLGPIGLARYPSGPTRLALIFSPPFTCTPGARSKWRPRVPYVPERAAEREKKPLGVARKGQGPATDSECDRFLEFSATPLLNLLLVV
ncbi:hypothetical protein C8J57DRAFT_1232472 [Mycena rebaudengoi]|nr:hypothetical protein C8J57DRAFT_1232472 [Mycena rebaudengoi]